MDLRRGKDYRHSQGKTAKIGAAWKSLLRAWRNQGTGYTFRAGILLLPVWKYFFRFIRRPGAFQCGGKAYPYFIHGYNTTWRNERSVELPIILGYLEGARGKEILEVGNVLSHYLPVTHKVLDKYESGASVLAQDILDHRHPEGYDLILSISTFEHIGWDERPRDPEKALQAFERVRQLLRPGAKAIITFPLGYNRYLDHFIQSGRLPLSSMTCLRRISLWPLWRELVNEAPKFIPYGSVFPSANEVVIGVLEPISCTE